MNRTIVCALLLSTDDKLLLGRRVPGSGGVYPECWQLPGGGVEPGETLEQALRRETLEEIGFDIGALECCLVDDQGTATTTKSTSDGDTVLVSMKFYVFRVSLTHPSTSMVMVAPPDSEFEQLRWMGFNELSKLELVPAGEPLFRRLGYWRQ